MSAECAYCHQAALYVVSGLAEEDGVSGEVSSLVCENHKQEFEAWESIFESGQYLHGYVYYEDIRRLDDDEKARSGSGWADFCDWIEKMMKPKRKAHR